MSGRFITIRHVADPVEAEMLADLLQQEGIPTTIPGNNHSAMLGGGLAAAAFRVPLQVPEEEAERARAILGALEEYDEVDPALDARARTAPDVDDMTSGDGPFRSTELEAPPPDRKRGVAVGAAIVLPMMLAAFGAGHFYARSYGRGFVLLAIGWSLGIVGLQGFELAWLGLPAVVLADAIGAVKVIEARRPR